MSAVHPLGRTLARVIVVRQADATLWRVEGYEQLGRGWRFTWLLHPATSERQAHRAARDLAHEMGLPVGEQRLGDRIRLVGGVLGGRAAA